jgi:hypothetical protein
MTSQRDLVSIARTVIDTNSYMTLATADRAGLPWPSPVWYTHSGYREFFWVSSPAARHSRNLAERPQAGIVIFDSHVPAGTAQAVYMTATAAEMISDELLQGIEVFSARSQALGSKPWTLEEVCAPASLRFYRASTSELFVIGRDDQRVRAEVGE